MANKVQCPKCNGQGQHYAFGRIGGILTPCSHCHGSGKVTISQAKKCWKCSGKGQRYAFGIIGGILMTCYKCHGSGNVPLSQAIGR